MGLFDRFRSDPASSAAYVEAHRSWSTLENPSTDLVQALSWYEDGIPTASGVRVNPDTALRHIAVYAAVRVIAESLGSLPFPVYRREGRSRIRLTMNDDYRVHLLNGEPNPYQTAEMFWTTILGHANLWGNGYAVQELDARGRVVALWPLDPRTTAPVRLGDGTLLYATQLANGTKLSFEPWEIIHIKAFGTGDVGISPIGVARQAIGEALAAEEYAGRFWQNDARPGGIIQYERKLADADHAEALRRWRSAHEGMKRAHMVAILDNGATWKDVGIPNGDSQFLESRKFGVRQIATLYRVPPHKIGDLEGTTTHATIEQQALDFVTDSLRPWAVRVEQSVRRSIFPAVDKRGNITTDGADGVYPEFNFDELARGDMLARFQAYAIARQWGWFSVNDILERENGQTVPNGDVYLQPLNMVEAGTDPAALAQAAQSAREFLAQHGAPGDPTKPIE
jgi:HK97 family phage portal protein